MHSVTGFFELAGRVHLSHGLAQPTAKGSSRGVALVWSADWSCSCPTVWIVGVDVLWLRCFSVLLCGLHWVLFSLLCNTHNIKPKQTKKNVPASMLSCALVLLACLGRYCCLSLM
jgi:hypothetical protein